MKTLLVGAGATGGYFGTRLAMAGRDVTFLVRSKRASQLRDGLRVYGPGYDETVPVQTITAAELGDQYDLVLLMTKAWSLEAAIRDIAPAVGPDTTILPLLNGMVHLRQLNDRFGADAVLGGIVRVVCTVTAEGAVFQMKPHASLTFGAQDRQQTERLQMIGRELKAPGFSSVISGDILASMWHKWAFITAGGVVTCLMRGPIGHIMAVPAGKEFILDAIDETERVAAAAGYPVSADAHAASLEMFTEPGSVFTSSLYRDVVAGNRHEGEHLLGQYVRIADSLRVEVPLTRLALTQLRVHEQAAPASHPSD
ncbi:ketopantoate reductase family protein [Arthrobacter sp. USHLN218]|uniref:ketopantoate reductase family protein n=1 Tax=Arthrobacter sp. USHLN218 TaxID=3081232 RepID=UPI003018B7C4